MARSAMSVNGNSALNTYHQLFNQCKAQYVVAAALASSSSGSCASAVATAAL